MKIKSMGPEVMDSIDTMGPLVSRDHGLYSTLV